MREFAVRLGAPADRVVARCLEQGVNPGVPLARLGLDEDGLLVAITERRSRADIDRLAAVLGAAVAAEREAVAHERSSRRGPASVSERHGEG